MGKWPDFEYHVGKWLKYDRSGYNSSHPSLGSPLDLGNPWRPLATLGDPWRPLATCLKMTNFPQKRGRGGVGRGAHPCLKGTENKVKKTLDFYIVVQYIVFFSEKSMYWLFWVILLDRLLTKLIDYWQNIDPTLFYFLFYLKIPKKVTPIVKPENNAKFLQFECLGNLAFFI